MCPWLGNVSSLNSYDPFGTDTYAFDISFTIGGGNYFTVGLTFAVDDNLDFAILSMVAVVFTLEQHRNLIFRSSIQPQEVSVTFMVLLLLQVAALPMAALGSLAKESQGKVTLAGVLVHLQAQEAMEYIMA